MDTRPRCLSVGPYAYINVQFLLFQSSPSGLRLTLLYYLDDCITKPTYFNSLFFEDQQLKWKTLYREQQRAVADRESVLRMQWRGWFSFAYLISKLILCKFFKNIRDLKNVDILFFTK